MNLVQKIRQLTDDIIKNANALQTQKDWELVASLLARTPVDQTALKAAVKAQDAAALDAIVAQLENPAPKPAPPTAPIPDFSHDDKTAALRAFKKRLKLQRLSDESRLGGRYTSGGRASNIDAITPPLDFPPEIWQALVADKRLVDTGQGFYALP